LRDADVSIFSTIGCAAPGSLLLKSQARFLLILLQVLAACAARGHVSLESVDLDKSLLADVAGVRFLSGVGAVMDLEVGRRDERPLALRAPVRPLLRVDSHVQFEVAGLNELT